jgi:hypothetical protein
MGLGGAPSFKVQKNQLNPRPKFSKINNYTLICNIPRLPIYREKGKKETNYG